MKLNRDQWIKVLESAYKTYDTVELTDKDCLELVILLRENEKN